MAAELDEGKPMRKMSEAFKELAATVNSQTETVDVEVAPFCRACSLVSPLIGSMGIAFKFAVMYFTDKVNDLTVESNSIRTLQELLERDIEANTVRKVGSHSRNLLRVKRGLDLVRVFFEQILATEDNSLKEVGSKAYEQSLAPHHGWAIRKAVAVGIYALPTRAQLLKKVNEDDTSSRIQMQNCITASAPLIMYIDKLFLSRELGIDW